jgi:hypothetical protein
MKESMVTRLKALLLCRSSLYPFPHDLKSYQPIFIKRSFLIQLVMTGMFTLGMITAAQATPINLALTGTATQSSTYIGQQNLEAKNAIDGNTDGNVWDNSVTHTQWETQPWWQVNLLGLSDIDQIVLWNRTDGCSYRLSNFSVSVLDNLNHTIWIDDFFSDGEYPNPSLTIDLPDNTLGEIVKVNLIGSEYLSLAEVQVFGAPVPEPGTMLLLASGLVGLAGYRKLKKK